MENYYNSWFGGSENNTTDSSYGYDMYDMYHITYDSEGYVLHIDNPVDNNESKAISIEDKKLDSSTPLFIVSSFSNVVERFCHSPS